MVEVNVKSSISVVFGFFMLLIMIDCVVLEHFLLRMLLVERDILYIVILIC